MSPNQSRFSKYGYSQHQRRDFSQNNNKRKRIYKQHSNSKHGKPKPWRSYMDTNNSYERVETSKNSFVTNDMTKGLQVIVYRDQNEIKSDLYNSPKYPRPTFGMNSCPDNRTPPFIGNQSNFWIRGPASPSYDDDVDQQICELSPRASNDNNSMRDGRINSEESRIKSEVFTFPQSMLPTEGQKEFGDHRSYRNQQSMKDKSIGSNSDSDHCDSQLDAIPSNRLIDPHLTIPAEALLKELGDHRKQLTMHDKSVGTDSDLENPSVEEEKAPLSTSDNSSQTNDDDIENSSEFQLLSKPLKQFKKDMIKVAINFECSLREELRKERESQQATNDIGMLQKELSNLQNIVRNLSSVLSAGQTADCTQANNGNSQ